jgi:hypothetical protein
MAWQGQTLQLISFALFVSHVKDKIFKTLKRELIPVEHLYERPDFTCNLYIG